MTKDTQDLIDRLPNSNADALTTFGTCAWVGIDSAGRLLIQLEEDDILVLNPFVQDFLESEETHAHL